MEVGVRGEVIWISRKGREEEGGGEAESARETEFEAREAVIMCCNLPKALALTYQTTCEEFKWGLRELSR